MTPEQIRDFEAVLKANPAVQRPLPSGGLVISRPEMTVLAICKELDRILTPEQKTRIKRKLLASSGINLSHLFATEPAIANELALTDRQKLQLKQFAETAAKQLIEIHRKNTPPGKLAKPNQAAITKQRTAVNDSFRKKIDELLTVEQQTIVKSWRGE